MIKNKYNFKNKHNKKWIVNFKVEGTKSKTVNSK